MQVKSIGADMEIAVSDHGTVIVVSVQGELNALTSPDLAEQLAQSVRQCGNLVVDMTHVRYISSAGLHVLFAAIKACRQRNGDLCLVGLEKNVHRVLEMSGLLDTTQVFGGIDAAIASFTAR